MLCYTMCIYQCIVYSTDTNVISLWATDWDLSRFASSKVYYYYPPKKNDPKSKTDMSIDDCDSTSDTNTQSCRAFHVMYHKIYHYDDMTFRERNPLSSSFGASIYEDG